MRCMFFAAHVYRVVNECFERRSRACTQLFNVMRDQEGRGNEQSLGLETQRAARPL
jgi:hypothetical protein